jgi:glycosyltransferase involved in cell wall biosynthesis
MNILFINYEYPPIGGGAAQASKYLGEALVGMGHHVAVLTSSHKDLQGLAVENGVWVYRIRSHRPYAYRAGMPEMISFMLAGTLAAGNIARRTKAEGAIAFFTIPGGPIACMLKIMMSLPYVISLRGGDVPGHVPGISGMHTMTAPLRRAILNASHGIVANSLSLAQKSFEADPYPVSVIPNGVDTEFFRPRPRQDTPFRILYAGRLHPEKNLSFLLDQLELFSRDERIPFELHIAGEGPGEADLRAHADSLSIRHRVVWHGWCGRDDLRTLYQEAACLVNSSFYEGMSNVILEAMASGIPVVASSVPGNTDLIDHGKTGILFALDDPSSLRSSLKALAENHAYAEALGRNARAFVEREHTWGEAARRYLEILEKK